MFSGANTEAECVLFSRYFGLATRIGDSVEYKELPVSGNRV